MKNNMPFALCSALLLAMSGCGDSGGAAARVDAREQMLQACDTQQGIGWLKREYGEQYCECWADQAKEVLSPANYATLVDAVAAELEAADAADRERIARRHTEIYSTVADAAARCARAARPPG